MDTPICKFVHTYCKNNTVRMHMPGHKGCNFLGCEHLDVTEVFGADSLYQANGVIAQSEQNASKLFGCNTFYSAEGSSLAIRSMLYLVLLFAKSCGKSPTVLACRNVHKSFLSGVALLDLDVVWLPHNGANYLSCNVDANFLDGFLQAMENKPTALYVTCPNYLGEMQNVQKLAHVCHKHGVLLAVDNAHGAYLAFLQNNQHPMALGADVCCDSAHKTLPVLTGGAYLHVSHNAPKIFVEQARNALSLFGLTSPSYLILQSLDLANKRLAEGYASELQQFALQVQQAKSKICSFGWKVVGEEQLKITLQTKQSGYTGVEIANVLRQNNVECEFCDQDFVVLMLSPQNTASQLQLLVQVLQNIPQKQPICTTPPRFCQPIGKTSIRQAMLGNKVALPTRQCLGKICADANVGCPPAVPIVMCGEVIDQNAIDAMLYYGIDVCQVLA